jgi:hypothetical protein
MQYFVNLTSLKINGEATTRGASAFLTSSALLNFFNQTTTHNTKLTTLEMVACARNYVKFDIEFTSRLINLTSINYAANSGITNVGPLVNLPMAQLTYVNITGTGVTFEFSEYVMENIYAKNNSAVILYTPDAGGDAVQYKGAGTPAESLTFLNEIGQIKAEYLQLCQQIATGAATADQIIWRIESGNMIQYVTTAGGVPEINTADGMNQLLANYYYCSESVGGLVAGHIYQIYLSGGDIAYRDLGLTVTLADEASDIPSTMTRDEIGVTSGNSQTITYPDEVTVTETLSNLNRLYRIDNNDYYIRVTATDGSTSDYINVKYVGYRHRTVETTTTSRSVTYRNYTGGTKTVYYYYTGTAETATIGGNSVPITSSTVIKVVYEYVEATSSTTETTTTTTTEEIPILYYSTNYNATLQNSTEFGEEWTRVTVYSYSYWYGYGYYQENRYNRSTYYEIVTPDPIRNTQNGNADR